MAPLVEVLTAEEVAAIRTTRNIAAHSGYKSMNDDLFWLAVTERIPDILGRLMAKVNGGVSLGDGRRPNQPAPTRRPSARRDLTDAVERDEPGIDGF